MRGVPADAQSCGHRGRRPEWRGVRRALGGESPGTAGALQVRVRPGVARAGRVYVPTGEGTTTRPIGVPTFEDKVLQRAVAMVLEAVYEQDFLECSYTAFAPGARPTRRCRRSGRN